jgi:hypothetical protein
MSVSARLTLQIAIIIVKVMKTSNLAQCTDVSRKNPFFVSSDTILGPRSNFTQTVNLALYFLQKVLACLFRVFATPAIIWQSHLLIAEDGPHDGLQAIALLLYQLLAKVTMFLF